LVFSPWHVAVVSLSSDFAVLAINDEQSVLPFHGQHAFALDSVIAN
jgi:hypothetical protein